MAAPNTSLRDPQHIKNLSELEAARKKAALNASQDRLLLSNNLDKLKRGGPAVLLQNVVLPVAAVGAGIFLTSKLVGQIFSGGGDRAHEAPPHSGAVAYAPAPPAPRRSRPTAKQLATYLPLAIKAARMGVSYLEKNGTTVPPLVHALLSSPGAPKQDRRQTSEPPPTAGQARGPSATG